MGVSSNTSSRNLKTVRIQNLNNRNKNRMDIKIIFVCLFLTPTFTIILPMLHKIFRNTSVYIFSIIFSLAVFLKFAFKIKNVEENDKEIYFVCCFTPITFLILYKFFDYIITRKFNRNIYFFANFIGFKDGESENSNWLDKSFQMILFIIPAFWYYIGTLIFKM